jgi:hypothetical protein
VVVVLGAIGAYALRDRSNPTRDARLLLDRYDKAENVDRAIALLEPAVTARPADPVRQTLLAEAYWRRYETTRDKTLIDRAANAAGASLKLNQNYAPTHVVWPSSTTVRAGSTAPPARRCSPSNWMRGRAARGASWVARIWVYASG